MSETFAARLTADVPSAIATIAVVGPGSLSAVEKYAHLAGAELSVGCIRYARWRLHGGVIREQVVLCRVDQHSVEIHCHGGSAICRAIVDDLARAGCSVITAQQWSAIQASLNPGSCPLSEAAAEDLLLATTDRAAAILLDQLNGALATAIRSIQEMLAGGEHRQAAEALDQLLHWSRLGMHLAAPWRVVLAGPPNVGKSSLTNAIVGSQQSIVHHEPGTTRDWVETQCAIGGWPVCLTDTAGLRSSADAIELAGIERARQQVVDADLVVAVVDATNGWTAIHDDLCQVGVARGVPVVVAWNKADVAKIEPLAIEFDFVETIAVVRSGIDQLLNVIGEKLVPTCPATGTAVPFRPEQTSKIKAAREAVAAHAFRRAEEILTSIFVRVG